MKTIIKSMLDAIGLRRIRIWIHVTLRDWLFPPEVKDFSDPDYRKQAIENLKLAKRVLDENGVPYWLSGGTLLGCIRGQDLIPHDNDVDLGVFVEEADKPIIKWFEEAGFTFQGQHGTKECGLEYAFILDGVKIDVFFHYIEGETMWMGVWKQDQQGQYQLGRYRLPLFDHLIEKEVFGEPFSIPDNYLDYLVCQYGEDWRVPVMEWDWFASPTNIEHGD